MKFLLLLSTALLISVHPAHSEETELNDWANCQIDEAIRLDDGKSDAATIARAVSTSCSMKRELWLASVPSRSFPNDPKGAQAWMDYMRDQDIHLSTAAVLSVRAKMRAKKAGRSHSYAR